MPAFCCSHLSRSRLQIQRTPLRLAARAGCLEAVRALLEGGADPEIPDSFGCTALRGALLRKHWAVVALLLSYGALPTSDEAKGNQRAAAGAPPSLACPVPVS